MYFFADCVAAVSDHVVHAAQPRDGGQAHLLLQDDPRDREGPRGDEDTPQPPQVCRRFNKEEICSCSYLGFVNLITLHTAQNQL